MARWLPRIRNGPPDKPSNPPRLTTGPCNKVSRGVIRLGGGVTVATAVMVVVAMRHARHHELGIVLVTHVRQLFEKRDSCPQLFVAVIAPGRHAGHLDAVLDDPEQLGWSVERRGFGKIWRWRIKASRDVALRDARRAVADGAMRCVMLNAHKNLRRVIEPGRHSDAGRLRLDRAGARSLEKPGCNG